MATKPTKSSKPVTTSAPAAAPVPAPAPGTATDSAAVDASQALGTAGINDSTGDNPVLDAGQSSRAFIDLAAADRQALGATDEPVVALYRVTSVPIRHNGEFYPVGDTVLLNDADAARLGQLVTIAPGASDEN